MTGRDDGHSHTSSRRKPVGGPADGSLDWFAALDIAVWVSVAVIAVLALEWFIGKLVRENIAAGASRYLKKQTEEPAS